MSSELYELFICTTYGENTAKRASFSNFVYFRHRWKIGLFDAVVLAIVFVLFLDVSAEFHSL